MPLTTSSSVSAVTVYPSGIRHRVLWLTIAVYMITYMDRICSLHAAPEIRKE